MTDVKPNAWGAFWQLVVRYQKDKVNPSRALRNTIGVALPLAAGVGFGSIVTGLAIATGALNVAFSDNSEPYRQRTRRMFAASLLVGFTVFAGGLSGRNPVTAVVVAGVWAFAAGLLVALSTTAADLGTMSLVVLLVYAATPLAHERAGYAGLLAFAGGLFETVLAVALWPLRPHNPERLALGALYAELARVATSPALATEAPPASAQSIAAQNALDALNRDHSLEAERYRLLLSQAERMRLALMTLARLRTRIQRECPVCPEAGIVDQCFAVCSKLLASAGAAIESGQQVKGAPESLQELHVLAERLREPGDVPGPFAVGVMATDARTQMDALAGQLRAAADLASSSSPAGLAAFDRREFRAPWRLRLAGTLATLRANLSLHSAACRHAIRLASCVALGDAVAHASGLARPYWLPMTIAIVLKPDFTATFSRGVLRLGGTFAGLLLSTALFHILPGGSWMEVALLAAMMFALRCFGPANYGILVMAVTALVVLLFALTGVAPGQVITARGVNTAAGGLIALLAYGLWPTWERTQVRELLARMLDAYREYFHFIRDSYTREETAGSHELDSARQEARLARSNLEASIDRLFAEPGTSAATVSSLGAILATAHRLVHALMALEAGLSASHPVPARQAFRPFAASVEATLETLAAALRGAPLDRDAQPDLREAHHALVESGDSLAERYALVNVETDRITNSLNTLTEELDRWLQPAPVE